jgi:hypothetical protein
LIDRLRLRSIARAGQLLARAEEGQRLKNLGSGPEEFAMQLTEGLGLLDGNFGRELTAALARANLFAAGAAVHIAASFQFDEIASVAEDDGVFEESGNGLHLVIR